MSARSLSCISATRADSPSQFLAKYTPLYERRQAIIAGSSEPTDADVEAGKASEESDDEEEEEEGAKLTEVDESKDDADVKGIPEFWLTALKNAMPIAEQITDEDEEVRTCQRVLQCALSADSPGPQAVDRYPPVVPRRGEAWFQAPLPLCHQRLLRGL